MTPRTPRNTYPPSLLRRSVINQLIHNLDIMANVLRAHITPDRSWLEIKVSGVEAEIDKPPKQLRTE